MSESGSNLGLGAAYEAARILYAARQRCCVAARRARATGGDAGDRLPAHSASQAGTEDFMTAFRQGLKETGYVEGQNVTIEYRWADGSYDRQPRLMKELIDLRVNVIVTWGPTAIRTAKMVQAADMGTAIPICIRGRNRPGRRWNRCQLEPSRR
jgi:hypothetical protein